MRAGTIMVVLAAIGFGTDGPASQLAYAAGMEPLGFAAWRAGLGGILLATCGLWLARREGRRLLTVPPTRGEAARLGLGAMLGCALNLALFAALDGLDVGLALALFGTYPLIVAVAEIALGLEPLRPRRFVAIGAASVGVALLVQPAMDPADVGSDPVPIVLALAAALMHAAYILLCRNGWGRVADRDATTVIVAAAAGTYLALGLLGGLTASLARPFEYPALLPVLAMSGLVAGAGATLLFLSGTRRTGATRAAVLSLAEPIVGVSLAAAVLGQLPSLPQLVGGAIVIGMGVVVQSGSSGGDGRARPTTTPLPRRGASGLPLVPRVELA